MAFVLELRALFASESPLKDLDKVRNLVKQIEDVLDNEGAYHVKEVRWDDELPEHSPPRHSS